MAVVDPRRNHDPSREANSLVELGRDERGRSFLGRTGYGRDGSYSRRLGQQAWSASKAALRGAVTHVGLICDNSTLQPLLSQVIIGNRRRFTRKLVAAAVTSKPSGVHLFAEKSDWHSHDIMVRVLRLLAGVMEPYKAIWQRVLMLDIATFAT